MTRYVHPDYQTNGKFYVHVNVDNGGGIIIEGESSPFDTVIREYTVSCNPNVATPTATATWTAPTCSCGSRTWASIPWRWPHRVLAARTRFPNRRHGSSP
jgi:hypothetical protein